MPVLDFALMAVAATGDGETFNMLGAGVEYLRVRRLPAVSLTYLVARWEWDHGDANRSATVGVSCRCLENAELLHEATFPIRVREAGPNSVGHVLTPLPLNLRIFGLHVVELTVDGQLLKALPLTVVALDAAAR